jgi:hypothetical protein
MSRRHRASGHELLAAQIDAKVESFEADRAQQHHVAGVRKDHRTSRGAPAGVDEREPHVAFEHAAINRCLEAIDAHWSDAQLLEHLSRDPVVLAAGVHHDVLELSTPVRIAHRRHTECGSEDAHVIDHIPPPDEAFIAPMPT